MREVKVVFDVPGVTVAQFFATCYADGVFVQRFHSKHNGHDGTKVTPWEEVEDDAREKDDDEGEEDESEGELDGGGLEARQQQPGLRRRRRLVQFSVPLRMPDFIVRLAGVDSVSVLESQELTLAKGSRPRRRGGDGGGGSAESVELESMQLDCSPLLDLAVAQRFSIETGGFLRVQRREFEGAGASSSSSPASASGIRITALIRVSSGGPWGLSAAVEAAMASQAKSEAVALLTLAFEALSEAAELGGEGALPPPPGPPRVSDVVVVASGAEEAAVPAASAADVAVEGEGEDGEGEEEEEEVPLAVRETASSSSDDESKFAEEDEGDGLSLDDDGSAFQDALSQPPPSAADADAMFRMLDCVAARLLSLEREVEAARAIVEASCPDVIVVEKGFAQRLLSSVLPTSSLSWSSTSWWWSTEEGEKIRYPRSSGVAVAAAATAVIAAFVAVRGASSSSSSRSRV